MLDPFVPVQRILAAPFVIIVGQVKELVEADLVALQVAGVEDPHIVDAAVISQAHLLPQEGEGGGGHPLVADGPAVVVHMVVHAPAAAAGFEGGGHFRRGEGAHEAVVVLTQHADGVGEALPVLQALHVFIAVEEGLDLLVQRQQPGLILRFGSGVLLDKTLLGGDDVLEVFDVGAQAGVRIQHGGIILAAHADGDQVLIFAGALQAIRPEAGDALPVAHKVPVRAVLAAVPDGMLELFARPQAGFVMGITHHDAVFVRQLLIEGTGALLAEDAGPHGRPHVVGLQPQQQLEDVVVHVCVDPAEVGGCPGAEAGPFVVDEQAPVFDAGLLRHGEQAAAQPDVPAGQGIRIAPVAQGGYADVPAQLKHAELRAPLV